MNFSFFGTSLACSTKGLLAWHKQANGHFHPFLLQYGIRQIGSTCSSSKEFSFITSTAYNSSLELAAAKRPYSISFGLFSRAPSFDASVTKAIFQFHSSLTREIESWDEKKAHSLALKCLKIWVSRLLRQFRASSFVVQIFQGIMVFSGNYSMWAWNLK